MDNEKNNVWRESAMFWRNQADLIEQQRVVVFRALADMTAKHDAAVESRDGWRVAAFALAFVFVVQLLNTYVFGGVA